MTGTRAHGKQTPRQREAAERNLIKGNPAAFSKKTKDKPKAKAKAKPVTYRAKQPAKKTPAKTPPADPAVVDPPAVDPPPRRSHPLGDVIGAIFG